jgi:hypothetical protein
MGALASGGKPPPNRKRRPGQEAAHFENNQINAQQISHTDAAWQQQAELAARLIARRHFLKMSIARIYAAELAIAGGGR